MQIILLFHRLGDSCFVEECWEAMVAQGYATTMAQPTDHLGFYTKLLFWQDGVLAWADHNSLLYGGVTYGLLHVFDASYWLLRMPSAIYALLCSGLIFIAGRLFFNSFVGLAATALFVLNPVTVFYGRYASSPMSTIFSLLLAWLAAIVFINAKNPRWWLGPVCALALCLATLQYAPGRLVVLGLLGQIILFVVLQWRGLGWRRGISFVLLLAIVTGFASVQAAHHPIGLKGYTNARGEQIFRMLKLPGFVSEYLGETVSPQDLTLNQKLSIACALARERGHELMGYFMPENSLRYLWTVYFGPLAFLFLWGVLFSIIHCTRPVYFSMLVWITCICAPVCLTNRVDIHRLMVILVPVVFFQSVGLLRLYRCLRDWSKTPKMLFHAASLAFVLPLVLYNVSFINAYRVFPKCLSVHVINKELGTFSSPVQIAHDGTPMFRKLYPTIITQTIKYPRWPRKEIDPQINQAIYQKETIDSAVLQRVTEILETNILILAPSDKYRTLIDTLQNQGYQTHHTAVLDDGFTVIRK